ATAPRPVRGSARLAPRAAVPAMNRLRESRPFSMPHLSRNPTRFATCNCVRGGFRRPGRPDQLTTIRHPEPTGYASVSPARVARELHCCPSWCVRPACACGQAVAGERSKMNRLVRNVVGTVFLSCALIACGGSGGSGGGSQTGNNNPPPDNGTPQCAEGG